MSESSENLQELEVKKFQCGRLQPANQIFHTEMYHKEYLLFFQVFKRGRFSRIFSVKWPSSPWVLVAQWMEQLPGVCEVMGSIPVRDSHFFFVPHSCYVDQFTFHISVPSSKVIIFIHFIGYCFTYFSLFLVTKHSFWADNKKLKIYGVIFYLWMATMYWNKSLVIRSFKKRRVDKRCCWSGVCIGQ